MAVKNISADKLKKMLNKSSGGAKALNVILIITIGIMAGVLATKKDLWSSDNAVMIVVSVILVVLTGFMIFKNAKAGKARKAVGAKTVESLECRGMLEQAAAEYSGTRLAECKATNRRNETDKLSRKNFLTESFVYAMADNVIVPYSDIAKVYTVVYTFVTRNKNFRMKHVNHVLTAMTNDGEEFDILSAQDMFYNAKAQTNIETIKEIIKQKNPSCEIIEGEIYNNG